MEGIFCTEEEGINETIHNYEINRSINIEEIDETIHIEEIDRSSHINRINEHCLTEIFLHLPIEKMLEVEEVCVWWQFVIDRTWPRVRRLEFDEKYRLSDGSSLSIDFFEKVLMKCGAYLRELRLERINSSHMLRSISNYCSNLTTVYLQFQSNSDCHVQDAEAFLVLEQIKSFTIKDADERYSIEFLLFLPSTVESIHLLPSPPGQNSNLSNIFRRFDALDCLEIVACLLSLDMMNSLSTKQTITKLSLSRCDIEEGMDRILRLRNLEYLNLDNPRDELIQQLVERCQKLKYLKLYDGEYMTDQSIERLRDLHELEELYLGFMEKYVTDSSIGRLRGIKKLHCVDCRGVGDSGIMQLIENCPDLQELNVKGTSITVETLRFAINVTRNRTNSVVLKIIADLDKLNFDVENEGHSPFLIIEQS